MEDTGRIQRTLDPRARKIFFGETADQAIDDELGFYVEIDRAHVVMLVERNIISREYGQRLLETIGSLAKEKYAPLRGQHAPRGLYLLYEQWLIETLGPEIGGAIHIGRSRNDIYATILRLRLRTPYKNLICHLSRLIAILIRRVERYRSLTMPLYTHYQPALPVTYGHYLCGIALALLRDLQGIENAVQPDRCPLGAGAGGGTTIAINTGRTAQLLGFANGVLHSVDAVASRDVVLRLLAAVAILGVTLSRAATDLLLWSTEEFGFIRLPDNLVGSSSMLPQKRNAFILEHVKGRSGATLGAFSSAVIAMHATPFSNSVSVGTEGVKPLWGALNEITDTVLVLRLVLAGAQPHAENMRNRAVHGFTAATEVANTLVQKSGTSFRQAHHRVGKLVSAAIGNKESLFNAAERLFLASELHVEPEWIDPSAIAERAQFGGGPAPDSITHALEELRRGWSRAVRSLADQSARWRQGARALEAAVTSLLKEPVSPAHISSDY